MRATWEEFAKYLRHDLGCTADGDNVVMTIGPRVVQFAHDHDILRLEVVGNQHLPEAHQLAAADLQTLADMGWNEPDRDSAGNWWQQLNGPVSSTRYDELTNCLVATVRILSTDRPPLVVILTWNDYSGHRPPYFLLCWA